MTKTEPKRRTAPTETEAKLLSLCDEIGHIPSMNGPSFASFARWLERERVPAEIEDMTLAELIGEYDAWRAWARKYLS